MSSLSQFLSSVYTWVQSVTFNASTTYIAADTADGSDTKTLVLSGGGGTAGNTRGATVFLYGNEQANTGGVTITTGDVAGGDFYFQAPQGVLYMNPGGSNKWSFAGANLVSNATNGGDFVMQRAGYGIRLKEGSNARMGASALTAGSVVVSNTSVTANTRIFLTSNADGGTPGWVRVSARSASTSFTITSSSGTDTSTIAWLLIEPS